LSMFYLFKKLSKERNVQNPPCYHTNHKLIFCAAISYHLRCLHKPTLICVKGPYLFA
jgi:hypothetical protein